MNTVDVVTACTFVIVILAGVMAWVLQSLRSQRPDARIRARALEQSVTIGAASHDDAQADAARGMIRSDMRNGKFHRWLAPKRARIETVAGKYGVHIVFATGVAGLVLAIVGDELLTLPRVIKALAIPAAPVASVMFCYRFLVARFKRRFLDGFPDFLDLVVRAVRAGVPVTHVISTSAHEIPEPLRTEFQIMGDSLRLGMDIESVLDIAAKRIEIADFSFFCVCLTLQRETGGQLGETLESLAGIVRTRREIRLKTKALTGEARVTTKILAAIPLFVLGILYVTNPRYTDVLVNTTSGHKLATFSLISIVAGIAVITKMSRLDTTR
ncbi:tight adherence protein B [Pararobbsia alpina]|uniref:type II secretion system F family protein n=1 Tax=Pararobbsia alpina TaxID=621374 RepID=UPI0039A77D9C